MEKKIKNIVTNSNKTSSVVQKKLDEMNVLLSKTDMSSLHQLRERK